MHRISLFVLFSLLLALTSSAWAQVPANEDVGDPAVAGSLAYDPNADAWSVTGAGNDIWGNADQFHFVFRPLVGDGEGIAYVTSSDCGHEWSKVGVMIRESLDAGSKHVMVGMTGAHGVQTVWRPETGGGSQGATTEGVALPMWFKITRTGDTISTAMTWDQNKTFWIPDQTLTVPMNETVYIGMFVCSHQGDTACTAVFEGVDLQAPPYLAAWNVSPADGTLISDPAAGVTLSWMPGDTAASHNVHFGTTSPPELVTNQTETTYDTGALEGGTTYYYRIDEVEEDGTTIHEGQERSFKTQRAGTGAILREVWEGIGGVNVSDLTNNANYPANPSWSDLLTSTQSWDFADNYGARMIGFLAPETSGDYTFWIASDDASQLWLSATGHPADAEMLCEEPACCHDYDGTAVQKSDPVYLEGGQMYPIWALWKEGGGGDWCKVAWEGPDAPTRTEIGGYFLMPWANLWAWAPSPADGATGVAMEPTLSWEPAVDAVSYDVYVDGALLGNTAATSMPAGPFALSEDLHPSTHTWRVDVVTDSEVRTGAVWSFTVVNNRLIDDFEAYDIVPLAPPEQTLVSEAHTIPGYTAVEAVEPGDADLWAYYPLNGDPNDASGNGRDGTAVGGTYVDGPAGLGQGMLFTPESGDDYVDLGTANPSADTGQLSVSLWLKWDGISGEWMGLIGKRDNWAADDMMWHIEAAQGDGSVGANRHSGQFVGGYGVPEIGVWEHLAFTFDGTTGTLYRDGEQVGSGPFSLGPDTEAMLVFGCDNSTGWNAWNGALDEVRIYEDALTAGEVRHLAGVGDLVVPPVDVPDRYGPLQLHLEFEGDYSDSSGNGRDGTPVGDISIEDDPVMGQVVSLPGGDNQFVEVGEVGLSGNDPTTIACWAKADHTDIPDWTLIFGFTTSGGGSGSHFNIGSLGGPGGVGAHVWGWEETIFSDDEALDWHHYAMTYDGTTITYYGDGVYMDTDTGKSNVRDLSIRADNVHVGSRITQASSFPGKVDDARIYDYAMSDAEIAGLAGNVAENPITDTWSDWGFVDLILDVGTMKVDSAALPGLPYYIGEVSRTLPFADLNAGGAKALSIWFRGDEGNAEPFMYASLSDGDGQSAMVLYDGDSADVASAEWKEWNIDMRNFEGVDLSDADELAIGLAGVDGSAEADVVNVDDIRVYSGRCMPDLRQPSADLNDDCVVNAGDVEVMTAEWGLQEPQEGWEYRAAYYDARYPTGWADTAVAEGVRDYMAAAGYTVVDADELKAWMDARIADGASSVVVMCQDIAPDTVAETMDATCTLRKYLDAGGKVVQYADIPFYNQGHADGTTTNWANDGSINILGFSAAGAGWDSGDTVTITPAGAKWGLTQAWQPSNRPALPGDVDTILATDSDGDASAWAKHYVPGDHYRGFVYVIDFDLGSGSLGLANPTLLAVAEYKGALSADLSGDGTVDWVDFFTLLDSWLEEQLWPY